MIAARISDGNYAFFLFSVFAISIFYTSHFAFFQFFAFSHFSDSFNLILTLRIAFSHSSWPKKTRN